MAILDTAAALLADVGPDGTTITAVADRSGLAPSSIYDYFADDRSLIGAVAERGLELMCRDLVASIGSPTTRDEMATAMSDTLHLYLRRYETDLGLRQAIAFIDSDPLLMHININNSRRNASVIATAVAGPNCDPDVSAAILLAIHLSGSLASLAVRVDSEEASRLIEQFERMLTVTLFAHQ